MSANPMVSLMLELSKIYVIVLMGYASSKTKMLTLEGNGRILSQIVSRFAAPATFFKAAASIDFAKFDLLTVLGVYLGKIATLLCMAIPAFISSGGSLADSIAAWGVYSLFTGMCTAVPMGFPILTALYPYGSENPDNIPQYVMAWAAVRVALFAPICLAMLDYARVKKEGLREIMKEPSKIAATPPLQRTTSSMQLQRLKQNVCCRTMYQLLTNPLVVGVILGLVYNFAFGSGLPGYPRTLAEKIAAPYKFLALFFLGFKAGLPRKESSENSTASYRSYILPIFLISFKLVVSAVITRLILEVMLRKSSLKKPDDMKTAAYIFASLPPSAFVTVIASEYNVQADLINSAQIASIFLCAPVLLLSTVVSGVWSAATIENAERTLSYVSHSSSIIFGILVLCGFSVLRTWRQKPMDNIFVLVIFQILYSCLHSTCDVFVDYGFSSKSKDIIFLCQYFCRMFCRSYMGCIAFHLCWMLRNNGKIDFNQSKISRYYLGGCLLFALIASLFASGIITDSPMRSSVFVDTYKEQCQLWSLEQVWVSVIACIFFLSLNIFCLVYVAMSPVNQNSNEPGADVVAKGDTRMDSFDPGLQQISYGTEPLSSMTRGLLSSEDNSEFVGMTTERSDLYPELSTQHGRLTTDMTQTDPVTKTSMGTHPSNATMIVHENQPLYDGDQPTQGEIPRSTGTMVVHPNQPTYGDIDPNLLQVPPTVFSSSQESSVFLIKKVDWKHSDHTCFDPALHDRLNLDFYFRVLIIICINMVREFAVLILGVEMLLDTTAQGGYISTLYLVVILVGTQGLVTSLVFITTKDFRDWANFKLRKLGKRIKKYNQSLGGFNDGV